MQIVVSSKPHFTHSDPQPPCIGLHRSRGALSEITSVVSGPVGGLFTRLCFCRVEGTGWADGGGCGGAGGGGGGEVSLLSGSRGGVLSVVDCIKPKRCPSTTIHVLGTLGKTAVHFVFLKVKTKKRENTHRHRHTQTQTHTHTHTQTNTHTHTHTQTNTNTHTQTLTHTHTQTNKH